MEYWFDFLDQAIIYGVIVVALNVLIGYAGIFSAGSAAFAAVGGYTAAVLAYSAGWSTIPTMLVAIAIGAVIGVVVSAPILRLSEEHVMLMTLSLSILVITVASGSPFLGGAQGIVGLPTPKFFGVETLLPSDFTLWFAIALVIVVAICWRIGESPWGRLLRASRDNDLGVRSLGKSPLFDRILTFAIMCGITALGGAMLVIYNGVAAPNLFSLNETMLFFSMVIVGGIASIPGSLVGTVLVVGLTPLLEQVVNLAPNLAAELRLILFGVILVIIVRFRPVGIIKERHRLPAVATVQPPTDDELESASTVPAVSRGQIEHSRPNGARSEVVLEIKHLSKRFGGVVAVDDLNLELRKGEITALIGANGAGKSTVFNLITGAIRPDSGQVLLGERDITSRSPQYVARLGMVRSFQDLRIFPKLTPLENVMMAGGKHPGENVLTLFGAPRTVSRRDRALAQESASWLEFVGLDPNTKSNTEELAFAQQKQVAFARVLATRADIILLDEPLSGIEGKAVDELLQLVERMRSAGHTICIVEHSVQTVSRLADWAYFMETGHVTAEGRIEDLLEDPRLMEAYFGVTH